MWYVVGGIVFLVLVFLFWRLTSVGRGARERDERLFALLDPIGLKFDAKETVTTEDVLDLARRPELRFILYSGLREMGHGELLPHDFDTPIQQAEAALAYWMMHPNELQDPPEQIEHLAAITRELNGEDAVFHVFRYRMAEGHWAGEDWLLGLAGPVDENAEPYTVLPSAFSRCSDIEGEISAADLVEWWVDLVKKKGWAE